MKKFIVNTLAVFISMLSFSGGNYVSAESGSVPAISIPTVSASIGDTVGVPVQISNNPGIIAMGISIDYDSDSLQLIGVDDCNLFSGGSFTISGDYSVKPFRLLWENSLAKADNTENGTLAVLHFKVCDDSVSGLSEISVNTEKGDIFDVSLNDVIFETVNGGIETDGETAENISSKTTSVLKNSTETTPHTDNHTAESTVKNSEYKTTAVCSNSDLIAETTEKSEESTESVQPEKEKSSPDIIIISLSVILVIFVMLMIIRRKKK